MDSIQINTGEKRIAVNGDPERVIVFNPSDVLFAERFYKLITEFEKKLNEYKIRAEEIDENSDVDDLGIPVNTQVRIDLMCEACIYIREQIDLLFGKGTSQKAFGDALTLDMFQQFFEGITPFIQNERSAKIEKYTNKRPKRVVK
jgi:hypothetical protein